MRITRKICQQYHCQRKEISQLTAVSVKVCAAKIGVSGRNA